METPIRNLTREAMELAKRDILSTYPELHDKKTRQNLDSFEKMIIVHTMIATAEMYEQQLIRSVRT